jgi:uncharacterized protein
MKNELFFVFLAMVVVLMMVFFSANIKQAETEITLSNRTTGTEKTQVANVVRLPVPAVDEQGNGVATTLIVEAMPGQGRVLTDINHLLFFIDTQNSIQIAKAVAENITKVNTSKIDLIYQIDTNASAIGGPSAGAALTIATIAAIENKTLNPKVGITGTINPDGTIGKVGAVEEKAKASKEAGLEIFLVPLGQGTETTYVPKRECRQIGPVMYCTTEYRVKNVDISKDVNITVREVSTIEDALKYFFSQ